ncbi:MAG: ribosomal-protein-alanine N-acetyltransferase [Clostridiales bacterium]|nr:ribosomal-protein-alanine N-acetyltransferase [Clostridiales bacterium]
MKISKLSIQHIDQLVDLYNQAFGKEAWSRAQIIDGLNNKSCAFYGIFDGDTLVCFASIMTSLDDINLLDIATKQEYKQKGYAKALMEHLLSLKNKEQTFSLEVKSKNLPAIKLYQSFGFKTLNIRKKYYQDGDDALCMFLGC